jgi:hypothetical protein
MELLSQGLVGAVVVVVVDTHPHLRMAVGTLHPLRLAMEEGTLVQLMELGAHHLGRRGMIIGDSIVISRREGTNNGGMTYELLKPYGQGSERRADSI